MLVYLIFTLSVYSVSATERHPTHDAQVHVKTAESWANNIGVASL